MSHPLDKRMEDLLGAAAKGPEAMENWLTDLQEKVGATDGSELPDSIELEYEDGTKETINTTLPVADQGRFPQFYNHDNPMPQEMLDSLKAMTDSDKA